MHFPLFFGFFEEFEEVSELEVGQGNSSFPGNEADQDFLLQKFRFRFDY